MLWLCLYFPDLPLEALFRGVESPDPVAISAHHGNRPEILACNPAACAMGVRSGMAVSAAQALAMQLKIHPRNPEAEAAALSNLAGWLGQFTPSVSILPFQGILLDVAGSLRLFGGLDNIMASIRQGMQEMGYHSLLACAPTPLGAWFLTRAGLEITVHTLDELAARLPRLPAALLNQPASILETLHSLGVRTIGDCLKLPRGGLARRFGHALLDELDRALGKKPDPRVFYVPPSRFESKLELPAEVQETAALLFAVRRLIMELEGFLRGHGGGVQTICLTLFHEDLPSTNINIGMVTPTRDSRHLLDLLRERLERTELPAPVRSIALVADDILPLKSQNLSLFPDALENNVNWSMLVERLRARLGTSAVHGVCPASDHRPELAWQTCDLGQTSASFTSGLRPCWLLEKPRQLETVADKPSLEGPLTLRQGPERIESGWWDGQPIARDYYLAESSSGARFWIFREWRGTGGWYLHGIFG